VAGLLALWSSKQVSVIGGWGFVLCGCLDIRGRWEQCGAEEGSFLFKGVGGGVVGGDGGRASSEARFGIPECCEDVFSLGVSETATRPLKAPVHALGGKGKQPSPPTPFLSHP
jgi:hypothetical protein